MHKLFGDRDSVKGKNLSTEENCNYKPKPKDCKVYCGIDVDSITCGYAYSFGDTDFVWTNNNWADHLCYFSPRAPSAVFYDRTGEPVKFGFEACEAYMASSKELRDKTCFTYPGLLEDSSGLKERTTVNGVMRTMSEAELEHRAALSFLLGKHCMEAIEKKYNVHCRDMRKVVWAITVPASWETDDKGCFRRNVKKYTDVYGQQQLALGRFQLKIVPSSEALWLALVDEVPKTPDSPLVNFLKGVRKTNAVIVHSGDTTTEISLHSPTTSNIPLEKLAVNNRFSISAIFEETIKGALKSGGEEAITGMKTRFSAEWVELLMKFEHAKDAAQYGKDYIAMIGVSYSFSEAFFKVTGKQIEELLQQNHGNQTAISMTRLCNLMIKGELIEKSFYDVSFAVASEIVRLIDIQKTNPPLVIISGDPVKGTYLKKLMHDQHERLGFEMFTRATNEMSSMDLARGTVKSGKVGTDKLNTNFLLEYSYFKLFPFLYVGDEIKIGKWLRHGPFTINDAQGSDIRLHIYKMDKISTPYPKQRLQAGNHHWGYDLPDKEKIHTISVKVPPGSRQTLSLHFDVTMDVSSFQLLVSVNDHATWAVAECLYN